MLALETSSAIASDAPTHAGARYRISALSKTPEPDLQAELDDLLLEYYAVIVQKLKEASMPLSYTPEVLIASFWPNLHEFLPPKGRLFLVHDAMDQLVGCGTLHQVRPDAAEVKRLYVRPKAAGNGLGRAIVNEWINAAHEMGLNTLLLNVISSNREPLRVFEGLGFEFIDRYPECADPIEADPYFVYMKYEFD